MDPGPAHESWLPDNTRTTAADVAEGMTVVDSQGEHVGTVKAVRQADFLVDRQFQRDVYIPLAAVERVVLVGGRFQHDTHVMLRLRRDDIDGQHWPHPDL
jgi:hypothetical protein